jgi:Zn-dependent protease
MHLQASVCGGCGTHLAAALTSCPGCGSLVHREELERLRMQAQAERRAGAQSEALASYRRMLELLPRRSKQYAAIESELRALAGQVDAGTASAATPSKSAAPGWLAGLGGIGLLLWKAKWLFASLLGKGKFLLLGLTKAKTLLTMMLSLGAYWALWGWRFALGAVLSMYAHEMGHVAALRRFGVRASAPMFVPGLGALVRLEQRLASPIEEARTGLAGPVWGSSVAVLCYAVYHAFHAPLFGALAGFGAWINLFNMVPIWQLDGSRAFAALSRPQRVVCALAGLGCAFYTDDIILYAIALMAGLRAFRPQPSNVAASGNAPTPDEPPADTRTLFDYVSVLVVLSLLLAATRKLRGGPS